MELLRCFLAISGAVKPGVFSACLSSPAMVKKEDVSWPGLEGKEGRRGEGGVG